MRKFIVFGYVGMSATEHGECLYIGSDKGEAEKIVNDDVEYVRREAFEISIPFVRRTSSKPIRSEGDLGEGSKSK